MTRPPRLPDRPSVLISTYLEPHLVARVGDSVDVKMLYAPELLPVPRYGNDHGGVHPTLAPAQERRWLQMLASADVAFDFDWRDPARLLTNAPLLQWVQATSAGIGGFVKRYGLDSGEIALTTAAGTHAAPLAEFAVAGVLHFVKDVPQLLARQREHHWERHVSGQLAGRRATVVGLGSIGRKVATVLDTLGAHVTGVGRPGSTYHLPAGVDTVAIESLNEALKVTNILVLAVPLTTETHALIDVSRLAMLPAGAIVVNISRGQVIDESALTGALASGRLGGAVLDVFEVEPLPAGSPLWDLPNVLVSPHSASTAAVENEVLTDLFIDNLRRLQAGEPLRNSYDATRGY